VSVKTRSRATTALGLIGLALAAVAVGCATPQGDQQAENVGAQEQAPLASVVAEVMAAHTAPAGAPSAGEGIAAPAPGEPGMVAMRRINETQYRQTIADIFGKDIEIAGRFEADQRLDGLMAVGSAQLSISSGGLEQYISMARSVSDQVLDAKRSANFLPCKPANPKAADDACTAQFIRTQGRKLFRRPLTEDEVAMRVELANSVSTRVNDYTTGLNLALVSLLTAPEFLFRIEIAEADPAAAGALRLSGYTKAERLSYLLWNTGPDDELLTVAASGEIHTPAGLKKQVDRLIASPRVEGGVRALFRDMLQLSRFENTVKDGATFPKYSFAIAEAAQEQTLRTLVDHLLTRNGDYRQVFTTPHTFIDRGLAAVYDVPFLGSEEWAPYTQPAGVDHAGIITQVAFLSMFSHPGRTSPTKRGVGVQEIFLCRVMPLPDDDIDFSLINDTNNGVLKTVRARLEAHATEPTCAACHLLTDPVGLALERYDSIGQRRMRENGEVINVAAELNGTKFEGASGLGEVLGRDPAVPDCLVRNVFTSGIGRMPANGQEWTFLRTQNKQFADNGYTLRPLLKSVVSSPEFFNVVFPKPPVSVGGPATETAQNTSTTQAGGAE
jgi:hypothetical protein